MYSNYILKNIVGIKMNVYLLIGGILSIAAGLLHIGIIIKGPDRYLD